MACVLVPTVEAIVVTAINHNLKKKEAQKVNEVEQTVTLHEESTMEKLEKIPFTQKLGWLSKLLWGGSFLLIFEHVWHGEIVPFFPFLTAASNPADLSQMLHEMSTVGVTMSVLVTLVWAGMVMATTKMQNKILSKELQK